MRKYTTGCKSSAPGTKGPALPLRVYKGHSCTFRRSFPLSVPAVLPLLYTPPPLLYCYQTVEPSLCGLTEAMNAGICVCVLLAAFSGSSLGRPLHSQDEDKPEPPQLDSVMSPQHTRHTRSAPSSGQLTPFSKPAEDEAEDPRTSLLELLARLISRKGSFQRSSSLSSRASGPGPSHKIKDRDYLGWMDFGRRSAEEYEEYSS
eukprot:XP_014057621.1 PREDICTED: cholecystokinin-L isoform X1 [Salmo salar]